MENTTKSFTPLAIVIAGLIIAVAILGKDALYQKLSLKKPEGATTETAKTPEPAKATSIAKFKEYAKGLGLNEKQFNACLDSSKYKDAVTASENDATTLGIGGTPTLIINGLKISALVPYDFYKYFIDKELGLPVSKEDLYKTLGVNDTNKKDWDGFFTEIETAPKLTNYDQNPVLTLGDTNSKVVLAEYTDYQCPVCQRFFSSVNPQIKKDYIDTGKVKYVLKDFPLTNIHPNAFKAAESARCAGEQGKYIEMHDKLFNSQAEWSPLLQN